MFVYARGRLCIATGARIPTGFDRPTDHRPTTDRPDKGPKSVKLFLDVGIEVGDPHFLLGLWEEGRKKKGFTDFVFEIRSRKVCEGILKNESQK